ncbi:MAG: carotenoid oxygenase family protein, partial [Myxococcota bacterium]
MSNERYRKIPLLPIDQESTHTDLRVDGTIPPQLIGLYVRNGPNALGAISPNLHYFSGQGMVHGVRLSEGRALWYRNRIVRVGKAPEILGERDPGGPIANGIDASPNTNVALFGGRLYATIEGGANPVELGPHLDTIARSDLDGALHYGFTGHHKIDPDNGEVHGVVYSAALPGEALYVRLSPTGEMLHQVKVPLTGATQIHDMSITERFAIIYDLNVVFDPSLLDRTTLPITWKGDKPSRVGILPKDGSAQDVRWFEVDPCYVYHPLNAFETPDGQVVVDVSRYERAAEKDLYGPLGDTLPTIDRWTFALDGDTARAREQRLSDLPLDFPKVSPRVQGRPYRYGYTITATLQPSFEGAVKLDLRSGRAEHQTFNGGMASELTFVPRPGATEEDDGWLIGFVFQPDLQRSRLVILNGQDFAGEPAAS